MTYLDTIRYQVVPLERPIKDEAERQGLYKELFLSTENGKKVLEDLLYECALHRTAYSKEPNQTEINLGKQMIGYHLINVLRVQLQQLQEQAE